MTHTSEAGAAARTHACMQRPTDDDRTEASAPSATYRRPNRTRHGASKEKVTNTNHHHNHPCQRPLLKAGIVLLVASASLLQLLGSPVRSHCAKVGGEQRNDDDHHQEAPEHSSERSEEDQDELRLLSTRLPRQQFRLGLGPTTRAALGSTFKLVQIHKGPKAQPGAGDQHPAAGHLPRGSGKKISSATLKKLLSQTLPKVAANATSSSSVTSMSHHHSEPAPKGAPNFKFVFIQRANSSTHDGKGGPRKPHSGPHTKAAGARPGKESLAASVSKQLASSLLYSAASSLISAAAGGGGGGASNSSSAAQLPSLSTLAALAAQTSLSGGTGGGKSPIGDHQSAATNEDASANQISASVIDSPTSGEDIKRLSTGERPRKAQQAVPASSKAATTASKTRKSRPSRIYNLPVKFVANGQPSGAVMLHSIKQHFATIKRLQAAVAGSSKHKAASGQEFGATGSKRKKGASGPAGHRLTGSNSRLIYLPLKYLSNAKPHMLASMVRAATTTKGGAATSSLDGHTKASHKSSTPADTRRQHSDE